MKEHLAFHEDVDMLEYLNRNPLKDTERGGHLNEKDFLLPIAASAFAFTCYRRMRGTGIVPNLLRYRNPAHRVKMTSLGIAVTAIFGSISWYTLKNQQEAWEPSAF